MQESVTEVFRSVLRCPNVQLCIDEPDAPHPCREILQYQLQHTGARTYDDFQLPEPWCGQIDRAPILFVSSNPSIGDDQRGLGRMSDAEAFDSHHFALGGGKGTYVIAGVFTLDPHGNRSRRPVTFWARARDRAQELIPERPVVWGEDYAMTEIVRCKSKNEQGVLSAATECTSRHFERTLSVASARVLIGVGKGRGYLRERFGISPTENLAEREIAGKSRLIAFLPHPSGFERGPRSLAGLYTNDEMQRLREAVQHSLDDRALCLGHTQRFGAEGRSATGDRSFS